MLPVNRLAGMFFSLFPGDGKPCSRKLFTNSHISQFRDLSVTFLTRNQAPAGGVRRLTPAKFRRTLARMSPLCYGDNLKWLRRAEYFPNASADLVYLDPPFNSARIPPVESAVWVQIVKDVKEGSSK